MRALLVLALLAGEARGISAAAGAAAAATVATASSAGSSSLSPGRRAHEDHGAEAAVASEPPAAGDYYGARIEDSADPAVLLRSRDDEDVAAAGWDDGREDEQGRQGPARLHVGHLNVSCSGVFFFLEHDAECFVACDGGGSSTTFAET